MYCIILLLVLILLSFFFQNNMNAFTKVNVFQPSSRFDELPDDFDPSGKLPGSFDDGDPQTTNLYVGNLSPQVSFYLLILYFFSWRLLVVSTFIYWLLLKQMTCVPHSIFSRLMKIFFCELLEDLGLLLV